VNDARGFGVMGVDGSSRVVSFVEKPKEPQSIPGKPGRALASMGIYIFNARFLCEHLSRDALDLNSSHDFGKDIIPYLVNNGYQVLAHSFEDSCVKTGGEAPYWRDVGTIDSYWEANMELTKVTPDLNMYDQEWPIWTYQEQLPPAKFVFDDEKRRGMAVDSLVSGGCIISGATVRRSLLFSNVHVHSYCAIEDTVLLPNVTISRSAVLKRVVVDKNCIIPEGMTIGVDLEKDRKRFFVTDRGTVLVTPDMLGQDVHGLNVRCGS
jgi:glucose-1-phosphate adenylyltransferase